MSRPFGFKHSSETKIKMSLAQKGREVKSNFEGHKHTKDTKIKMSIASKKRWSKLEERVKVCGSNSSFWKGGRYKDKSGYIITACGYEHRIVMEAYLNRLLESQEIVHHINRNRSDNKIENLQLFTNQKEHMKYHRKND